MSELARALTGDSAAAPAAHILEGLSADVVGRTFDGVPHTIYQEVWHLAFWQQISLDWISGKETPYPVTPSAGFPPEGVTDRKGWEEIRERFLSGCDQAAAITLKPERLEDQIICPSQPGHPSRTMSVREQLESLAAHNSYHLGRIVLLRQLGGNWPPPSGGFSW
jgi:uncharacterized damage-inducible protein DinB